MFNRYLPVKTELVICCPLTPLQQNLYNTFVGKQDFASNSSKRRKESEDVISARGLSAITQLKKVV